MGQSLKTTIANLKAARELLDKRGAWIQEDYARDKRGANTFPWEDGACKFCALGALGAIWESQAHEFTRPEYGYLANTMVDKTKDILGTPDEVNDRYDTKHIHVLMSYDFAILMAEDDLLNGVS